MDTTGLLIGRIEGNGLVVVTNCFGYEIPVGKRFTQIIKHQVTPALPDIHRIDQGQAATVSLLIEEITLNKLAAPVEAIPEGWSAALMLTGDGVEVLIRIFQEAGIDEQIFLQ